MKKLVLGKGNMTLKLIMQRTNTTILFPDAADPNIPSITYDISQLFDFIDQLCDLSCLVYQKSTNTYAPYNKDWIKEKIYILLRRQASR